MYDYELIKGHYIVKIGDEKYLIDTGSPHSFNFTDRGSTLIIDGDEKTLNRNELSQEQLADTRALIGPELDRLDGFIGLDIINETSLTIYKNGKVDFKATDVVDSVVDVPIFRTGPYRHMCIDTSIGRYSIDTGAMYGYGVRRLFASITSRVYEKDYNPGLGHLEGYLYPLTVSINGHNKVVELFDNQRVQNSYLMPLRVNAVGNVTTLFDEVCVIDTQRERLVLK